MRERLELLAPAGNLEILKSVIHAGADAVYFGGNKFGARAYADNFSKEEVYEAIDFGHLHERKVIMAVNTILKQKELEEELYDYLLPYYERGLDAVIVQDFGLLSFVRKHFPGLGVHTSTQMTVTNEYGARFLANQGASRIVMAREMSLEEIAAIHQAMPELEIEAFVHGALCYCFSGQCLMSSMIGGRSGNRGRCAQPCRLPYAICSDAQGKQTISDSAHQYPLSLKDLCTISNLPKIAKAGVYSFKIEGRMKQAEYAAGVVSIYRKYMDRYLDYGEEAYQISAEDNRKLLDFGNRSGFTKGYYEMHNGSSMVTYEKPNHRKTNETLADSIRNTYVLEELKKEIYGYVTIKQGQPVCLTITDGTDSYTHTGEIPQPALKKSLEAEEVRKRLSKLGNTPFVLQNLEIDLEDGIFLPVSQLNELRRNAILGLELQIRRRYERTDAIAKTVCKAEHTVLEQKNQISIAVETKEQLFAVLGYENYDRLYVDPTMFSVNEVESEWRCLREATKKKKISLYIAMPYVFRRKTVLNWKKIYLQLEADGYLVKTYDELGFLLEQGVDTKCIKLDHSVYIHSNWTKEAMFALGKFGDTIPLEQNKKEIMARNNRNSEIVLYGYLPLMVSAQCVKGNYLGCKKEAGMVYLKDRKNMMFPVKNICEHCYNVIYNARPMSLMKYQKELEGFGIHEYRLSFTIEHQKRVKEILDSFFEGKTVEEMTDSELEFTFGHYKRGVE